MHVRKLIRCAAVVTMLFTAWPGFSQAETARELVEKGDTLYKKRAEGYNGDWASPVPIKEALESYLRAYKLGLRSAEVVEKLMRATYYYATYAEKDADKQKEAIQRAVDIGEEFIKANPDSVAVNYQIAGAWGRWGEANGIWASARQGVADRVKKHAEKVVALDRNYDEGGGYRTLGRLHFKAPRIPFILPWPSKDESAKYLEQAISVAPQNLTNHLFYAETLFDRGNYDKALQQVNLVLQSQPRPERVVEDLRDKKDAAELKRQISKEIGE